MNNRKRLTLTAILMMLCLILTTLPGGARLTVTPILTAEAAEGDSYVEGEYVLRDGSVNYRDANSEAINLSVNKTVQLMRVGADGNVTAITLAPGESLTIVWKTVNENVFSAKGVSKSTVTNYENFCELTILGVGYDNLTAEVTFIGADGAKSTVNYSWKFLVSLAIDSDNLTSDNVYNKEYGLRQGFVTDTVKTTLQIAGPEVLTDNDPNNDKYNSYLLLLKKADLLYEVTSVTGSTVRLNNFSSEEDVELSRDLARLLSETVVWSSSDNAVATVEYGVITGKSAGIATITATTKSDNDDEQSVSITVVVRPTGRLVTAGGGNPFSGKVVESTETNSFTLETNSSDATKLVWNVYQKDENGKLLWTNEKANQTTEYFGVQIFDTSGNAYFTNVYAGTYFITVRASGDYAENNANLNKLTFTITVPVMLPSGTIYMNVGDYYDIIENSTLPAYNWYSYTSDNEEIIKANANGVLEAVNKGIATVTLNLRKSDSASVQIGYEQYFSEASIADGVVLPQTKTLFINVIDAITLNNTTATIYVNGTLALKAYSSSMNLIYWTSSNEAIAKVNEDGIVTGLKAGQALITATQLVDGVRKTATCLVTVSQTVSGITLEPSTASIAVGENLTITASVKPALNGVSLHWITSDEAVLKITEAGALAANVTGVAPGTAVITAINKENIVVGSCKIEVYAQITGITLSQTSVTTPLSTGWIQLHATILPAGAEDREVIWKSTDTKVATVVNGMVTLKKPGTTTIIVTAKDNAAISASCTITVTKSVTGVKLDKTTLEMFTGDTLRLYYTITPVDASNASVTWSSTNKSVASVDSTGMVVARGVGTTVIMVRTNEGGHTATCTVTVGRIATGIALDAKELTLNAGETYQLETTLTPKDATESGVTYESSNAKVATVNKKGKITAKKTGTCFIFAKLASGASTYCTVNVVTGVTGLTLDQEALTVMAGETAELTATVLPKTASVTEVTWESADESIATIDEDGEIRGIKGGTTVITGTTVDGGYSAFCVVTVEELVTDIVLSDKTYKLGLGLTYRLTAQISGETASNKQVSWSSSDTSIVTVDENGRLRGIGLGYATITCTATDGSGAEDQCEIQVVRQVTEIVLDVSYLTLIQGRSYTLTARVYPANATYATPNWISEDPSVAIVDKNGVITALSPGNVIIRAEADDSSGVSAICYVTVIAPVPVTNISISEAEVVLTPGETKTVPISVVPSNYTEDLMWSSDNNAVARVDETTGQITAVNIGTANITVMSQSGRRGTIRVFVVGLSRTNVVLQQYTQLLLRLEVDGTGDKDITIRWDVDDQEIATVTNGRVTAKALGTTTVYAVVNGRKLSCTVTVVKIK